MPTVKPVQRVRNLSPALFLELHEVTELPVVIEGAVRDSDAVRTWSPESLGERFGTAPATFKVSSSNAHPDFRAPSLAESFARRSATFGEFLKLVTEGPPEQRCRYLFTGDEQFLLRRRAGTTNVDPTYGALLRDLPVPGFIPEERLYTVWGWFSGPGVRTWLHYDNNRCHNLNAQITGSKECLLFAPDTLGKLAPFPLGGHNPAHNCSQLDVERLAPDVAADLADVPAFEATLEAGDLLFIPAFWLHTFRHTGEFNSNLNFWWLATRFRDNPVVRRQALLDIVAASQLRLKDESTATLLRELDRAALGLP